MKPLFLSIAIVGFMIGNAQQWCAPGAQWYHDYSNLSVGDAGYVETHYTGDTLIEALECQILEHYDHIQDLQFGSLYTTGPHQFYTTTSPGLVSIWDGSSFDTLIHYNAVPGNIWQLPIDIGGGPGIYFLVIDTGHVIINGLGLRYLAVEGTIEDVITFPDTIYERIGPIETYLQMYLSEPFLMDYGYNGLRCYSDDEMSYSHINAPCEIALGIHSPSTAANIKVFPNPVSHQLCLGDLDATYSVELMDPMGSIVLRSNFTGSGSNCFPVLDLSTGTYFLRAIFKDRIHQEKVMIIQNCSN